jgi:hypothetical protein
MRAAPSVLSSPSMVGVAGVDEDVVDEEAVGVVVAG